MTDQNTTELDNTNSTPFSISQDPIETKDWATNDNPYVRDLYDKYVESEIPEESINAKLSILSTLYKEYLMHCNSDLVDETVKGLSEGEEAIFTKDEVAPFVDLRARIRTEQPDGPAIVESILISLLSQEARLSTLNLLSAHLSKEQKNFLIKQYKLEPEGCAPLDAK